MRYVQLYAEAIISWLLSLDYFSRKSVVYSTNKGHYSGALLPLKLRAETRANYYPWYNGPPKRKQHKLNTGCAPGQTGERTNNSSIIDVHFLAKFRVWRNFFNVKFMFSYGRPGSAGGAYIVTSLHSRDKSVSYRNPSNRVSHITMSFPPQQFHLVVRTYSLDHHRICP